MKFKETYIWDEATGIATYKIFNDKEEFVGQAHCHNKDNDMMSEKVGCIIASARARIAMCQYLKREETIRCKALIHFYSLINHSKRSNPDSYEVKMLLKQIQSHREAIKAIDEYIEIERKTLKEYIDEKDNMYQKIRKNREKKNKAVNN